MTIWFYLHLSSKRAKGIALLDSGATENFLHLDYAQRLKLPIKALKEPQELFNIDGTKNKGGKLKYFTDLKVRMGANYT